MFDGNKKQYESWKTAFMACVDSSPLPAEYRLLQMREYLSGEALKTIDCLGYSAAAYDAAKDKLERKFGGGRRKVALNLEEIEQFKAIKPRKAKDLEHFAELIETVVVNLRDANREVEIENGVFFTMLLRKLSAQFVTQYE